MITVRQYTSKETMTYREKKYQEFKDYFLNTTIPVVEIFDKIKVNRRNKTGHYIMNCLRRDGLNSSRRWGLIKRGEWL